MQKNSVNKAIIVGRLGQKPELRYTPSQSAVTNITIATNETRKDAAGNSIDSTEWHKVAVFGKSAEFLANYIDKGAMLYVEGKLQTRSWEDRDGVKKYTTEIVAHMVTPLGGGNAQSSQPSANSDFVGDSDDGEPLPF